MPSIAPEMRDRLWTFMGGIARDNKMTARCIGGVADHVHLLVSMPPTLSISKGIQLIKGGSSTFVNQTFPGVHDFAWQQGYGAFGVGVSQVDETIAYIRNQEEHHRHKSFQEEYVAFLKRHQIVYDEKYVWD
jgi:REP element-mobilizing transposase RayT